MAGKVIINAGPTGSGKSVRSRAWQDERPPGSPTRLVIDEGDGYSMPKAFAWAGQGFHVMVNMWAPEGVTIEVAS